MKSISKILMVIAVLLSAVNSFAQIKNSKTGTVKIYGNCDMCKATIENAGSVKKIAVVLWNKDTKTAMLTYDSQKTNQEEILKRIALAGYDSEQFLAPDEVYAKLPECCQYERVLKPAAKSQAVAMDTKNTQGDHQHNGTAQTAATGTPDVSPLQAVFHNYFLVKDALVKTDAGTAATTATALAAAIGSVAMSSLSTEEHTVWMKVMKALTANAERLSTTKDVSKQREIFALLAPDIYALMKVSRLDTPVYYQHCPMFNDGKGAHWLSKESTVKNPFYGNQMLTCGKTVETIK